MEVSLEGWDIVRADQAEWVPWGGEGDARAKVLGSADGYVVVLVEAQPGSRGDAHVHAHAEFFYLNEGTIQTRARA